MSLVFRIRCWRTTPFCRMFIPSCPIHWGKMGWFSSVKDVIGYINSSVQSILVYLNNSISIFPYHSIVLCVVEWYDGQWKKSVLKNETFLDSHFLCHSLEKRSCKLFHLCWGVLRVINTRWAKKNFRLSKRYRKQIWHTWNCTPTPVNRNTIKVLYTL